MPVALLTAAALTLVAAAAPQQSAPETTVHRIDRARLMADVRALADPGVMEGRRTGTPGAHRARAYIERAFEDAGVKPLGGRYERPFSFVHRSAKGLLAPGRSHDTSYTDAANIAGVVGPRDGTRRWIVVSAHYDHLGIRDGVVYPGADDNASGVAALLALARVVAAAPLRHTTVFVAFDAEELGLEGAKHFVKNEHLTSAHVALDVNLDMVSRNDRGEIYATGTTPEPWLRPILDDVQRRAAVKILFGHDRSQTRAGAGDDWTQQSDQGAFFDAGIDYLYFGVDDHADYHRPTDTADRIDPAFFGDVTDMIADALMTIDQRIE
jgi:Zn-dependent M28 family amino/carboxypeptidase